MVDVVTIATTDGEPESLPETIVPVVMPDNPAVVTLAYEAGEGNARLAQLEIENAELRARLDSAQTTATVALEVAIEAAETAAVAAEVAAEPTVESVPEPDPEPDHKPTRQHFMFREKDEWKR